MAIGNAGIADLDTARVDLWLGDVKVIDRGGRAASYREEDGARVMQPAEIAIRVELGRGNAATTRLDLRFFLRLRQDQRRVPDLNRALAPIEPTTPRSSPSRVPARRGSRRSCRRRRRVDWKRASRSAGASATAAARSQPVAHRAPDRVRGPAGHRSAEGAGRAQHAAVRRWPAGEQRAAHRRARHRQDLARESAASTVRSARACG